MNAQSFLLLSLLGHDLFIILSSLFDGIHVHVTEVIHGFNQSEVVFQTFGEDIFIDGLADLVLLFQVFDVIVFFFILLIAIDFDVFEGIEE